MNPEFRRVKEVFLAALERDESAVREAFLRTACGSDEGLHRQVKALLGRHQQAGSFLEGLPADFAGTVDPPALAEGPGTAIGPFKLLEQIGEGGFGTVFMAEQSAPVRRKVALKVLKPGMDSRQVVARFEAERQALALMDHPNIAKVFDGGQTDTGRPYFVMELVKGVPITDFCDRNHLSPRQRLELFVPVCHAVQHAHQKGLIHRDLKPSNVLVSAHDGPPAAKVIDFGIAKAVGHELTDKTLFTGFAQLVGTPLYMSPEQAAQSPDIDTRSDIYSLGVLLYELLTGTTPFDRDRLRAAGYDEIRRIIREEEPARPSTRLSTLGAAAETVSAHRGTEPRKLSAIVRGELDWIVMKALDKDRTRRYETADAFAIDVQCYLRDEPVRACPPSAMYRLRKLVRRNGGQVAATAALALVVTAGTGAVWVAEARASRARAAAETDRVTHEAWATASVTVAVREARERTDEAWAVFDYPDRMKQATDAAVAAIHRADDFAAGGPPTEAARAELAAAQRDVNDLARHTRLIVAATENRQVVYDGTTDGRFRAQVNLCNGYREALRQFGLHPLDDPVDTVGAAIARSRIRDLLLSVLVDWHREGANLAHTRKNWPQRADIPVDAQVVADRLEEIIRSARRQCGGPYARWQELLDRRDVPGLVALAKSPEGLSFRSSLVAVLGSDLLRAKEYQAGRAYLQMAVDRYPHDVQLHALLSGACLSIKPTGPAGNAEALRHLASASALRPDSAAYHVRLATYYRGLQLHDLAAAAYRKAAQLAPESAYLQSQLGGLLRQMKDWEGELAARREAARLDSDYLPDHLSLRRALVATGRHAEAAEVLEAIQKNPKWAKEPPFTPRFLAACDALSCVAGLVAHPPPPAEHPAFRKQALDLLNAELGALRRLAAEDRAYVHRSMLYWLTNPDLGAVRGPHKAFLQFPPEEQAAWTKLWDDVRDLRDRTAPEAGPPKGGM